MAKEAIKPGIIIQEQVRALLRIAYNGRDNIDGLRKILAGYKLPENNAFKVEAISFALEHMTNHPEKFPQKLQEEIRDLLVAKVAIKEAVAVIKEIVKADEIKTPKIDQKAYQNIAEYIEANARMPDSLDSFMKKAIDADDIKEVQALDVFNKAKGLPFIKIDGNLPLAYALNTGKLTLAEQMVKSGFRLIQGSKAEQSKVEQAMDSRSMAKKVSVGRDENHIRC